jgi:hypothetical protein
MQEKNRKQKYNQNVEKRDEPMQQVKPQDQEKFESKQIDKPIELFYNKGQLIFGNGVTNEEELRNFQSKTN